MRRLGDPFFHRVGFRGLLAGAMSWWPTRYPRLRSFYVDATGGADGDDGRTPGTAWQTIGKVNGETFLPGDYVLFKRGETWVGTALNITWSGTARHPIVFADYDAGAVPIIDGNDLVNCIVTNGQSYLLFRNLECTQGLDSGFQFVNCDYVTVVDCDAHDCGNDNLIFITGCHDCTVIGGEFYNAYERVATTITSGIEVADDCYNITISGATCRNNTGTLGMGITIHSHVATGMPYNITINNCTCHDNDDHGIQVLKQDNAADVDRNISIIDCTLYDNSQDGFRIYKSAGAANYPTGVTVDGCNVYGNTTYAYYIQGDDLKVWRNVLRGRGLVNSCVDLDFYNNTMYFETGLGLYPIYIQNARTSDVEVKNNITAATIAGGMMIGVDATVGALAVDIDYNLYYLAAEGVGNTRWHWLGVAKNWANWLADSGMDANSPAADQDPLFTNPGADDFTLQAGSPAIDAGTPVGLPFLGPAPDCGAFERE